MEYLQYTICLKYLSLISNCFKPCYKWNTFNTWIIKHTRNWAIVLNLVINGIPSIPAAAAGITF